MPNKTNSFTRDVIFAFLIFFVLLLIQLLAFNAFAYDKSTGNSYEYDCSAGKHQYTVTITKMPTETEDGERTFVCDLCGYTYTTVIESYGHKWSDWIVDKEPTCCEEGHRYRVCTKYPDYPHREEEIIPASGIHSYISNVTEPTCTEDGIIIHKCRYCYESYTESGAKALGHVYTAVRTEPTCTDDGLIEQTCSRCGDVFSTKIPAVGHSYIISREEPACTKDGCITKTCSICNDVQTEILPATGHNYVVTSVAATCDSPGYTYDICSVCGDKITKTTPELTHQYGEWIVDVQPENGKTGHRYRVCARNSSHITEEIIPALNENALNSVDVACAAALVGISSVFTVAICSDVRLIRWYAQKKARLIGK